jgi:inorganic phosphate transporter, PiT family
MDLLLAGLAIAMGLGVGWSIGANDAANAMGTAVGSKVLSLRQAVVLVTVFGMLGALLQGQHVAKTIGTGIIPLHQLSGSLRAYVALVAGFSACAWVVLATHWRMPISTSHSIVGAVAGAGMALGVAVNGKVIRDIFLCWIFTPVGAAIAGYVIFSVLRTVFPRVVPKAYWNRVLTASIVVSGCYVAYSWGANDVANATGVLVGTGILTPRISVLLGGAAIAVGVMTWGYKVMETIGSEITHLMPLMAFSAQLASAVNVHFYTLCGMPVSTSHSIVGAIFGVGLVKGLRALNVRIMREIVTCWLITPFVSGILSFLILKAIVVYIKG